MAFWDLLRFVVGALLGYRLRSALSALGVAIGVAAVVLLTSVGEGSRQFIVAQFGQFGTNLVGVTPGKVNTFGVPGALSGTTHKLTIDDGLAMARIPGVGCVVPVVYGGARVESAGLGRDVFVYGVTHDASRVWHFPVAQGIFLPPVEPHRRGSCAVLGPKLARELFPDKPPLGGRVRIGGEGYLIVGVMEPKGQFMGFDLDDAAYIPVANAMDLFNLSELSEVDVEVTSAGAVPAVVSRIKGTLKPRHRGKEDFTITTQTDMLDTLGRIIEIVTVAVSAIAGISLLVGAIGILTILWISVHERTSEIGLMRALGVSRGRVEGIFLAEAAVLALFGGLVGVGVALGIGSAVKLAVPGLPMSTPAGAILASLAMCLVVGLASGYWPARRAASMDPVEALRAE